MKSDDEPPRPYGIEEGGGDTQERAESAPPLSLGLSSDSLPLFERLVPLYRSLRFAYSLSSLFLCLLFNNLPQRCPFALLPCSRFPSCSSSHHPLLPAHFASPFQFKRLLCDPLYLSKDRSKNSHSTPHTHSQRQQCSITHTAIEVSADLFRF